jgi:formamidopyrimidine-DNA glycosylase
MPELPEVETIRRTLEARIVGARVQRVHVCRADVITRLDQIDDRTRNGLRGDSLIDARALLQGDTIIALRRYGKQLAIIGDSGRVICVHLGMSGQVRVLGPRLSPLARAGKGGHGQAPLIPANHVHVVWELTRVGRSDRSRTVNGRAFVESAQSVMYFRDPRRFGGIWTAPDSETMERERWSALGPDALTITPGKLRERLATTTRAIKAALLDQSILAGVGNIYADEALFRAGIHPLRRSDRLDTRETARLADSIRRVLRAAIARKGSTLRDYVNANGEAGRYAQRHMVYGRAKKPCMRCGRPLRGALVAQRTTVHCATCQPRKVRISVIHT